MPEHRGPELKPTPFIGVMTHSLSPEVRAQTGLGEGFGLLVEEVLPESPAKEGGLQQHDVLVLLGDQKLVNVEQLAVLVRNSAKGSELVFTIKRAGQEQKVTVKVGEKMMPAMQPDYGPRWPGGHSFGGFDGQRFGQELGQGMDRFQKGMREFQERMQDWARGPHDRPAPQPPQPPQPPQLPQFNNPTNPGQSREEGGQRRGPPPPPDGEPGPKEGGRKGSTRADSSSSVRVDGQNGETVVSSSSSNNLERNVTRRDRTGEYILRQDGTEKTFIVKPVEGEAKTFPVTTEEQRKAVPEAFRDKLHEMDEVSRRVKGDGPQNEGQRPPPPPGGSGSSI